MADISGSQNTHLALAYSSSQPLTASYSVMNPSSCTYTAAELLLVSADAVNQYWQQNKQAMRPWDMRGKVAMPRRNYTEYDRRRNRTSL